MSTFRCPTSILIFSSGCQEVIVLVDFFSPCATKCRCKTASVLRSWSDFCFDDKYCLTFFLWYSHEVEEKSYLLFLHEMEYKYICTYLIFVCLYQTKDVRWRHPQVRALCLVGCVVFLAVSAKFLLPECQFSYMLYEIGYIYSLSVFRPA